VLAESTTEIDTWDIGILQTIVGYGAILEPRMASVQSRIKIKVLIADDHAIFRDGLRKLLDSEEEITIIGEARNGAECIKMLGKLKPD
jgi:PleD family two-component response regulator